MKQRGASKELSGIPGAVQVVDRSIFLLSHLDQSLNGPLCHLRLWNVDRELVGEFFARHRTTPFL